MSTAPAVVVAAPEAVAAAAPVKKENGFERFIDKIVPFLKKAAPVVLEGAELARPLLALSPIGPEYNIALTGIETAIAADQAMQASSAIPLTGTQKMAVAASVASPVLVQILGTKGITEPVAVKTAIAQFLQNVYNMQTGPVAVPAAA